MAVVATTNPSCVHPVDPVCTKAHRGRSGDPACVVVSGRCRFRAEEIPKFLTVGPGLDVTRLDSGLPTGDSIRQPCFSFRKRERFRYDPNYILILC